MNNLGNTFFPARRRIGRGRKTVPAVVAGLMVIEVIDVEYDEENETLIATAVLNATVESPLNPVGGASAGKWNARYDDKRFVGVSLSKVDVDKIQIEFALDEADAGADELNYTNAPSDIGDSRGRFLAAFSMGFETE